MSLPFKENLIDGYHIRTFSSDIDEDELKWHFDEQDRIVVCEHDTDWQLQMDDELPIRIIKGEKYYIPEGIYHRIIKGTNDITFKIKKITCNNTEQLI